MQIATVVQLKKELQHRSEKELIELTLRLAKFKKENKELLTYLLFEADNESQYIENVKAEIDEQFEQVNTKSYRWVTKSVRKILRNCKKFIRFSKEKATEVEILLYFCEKLHNYKPYIRRSMVLGNILMRQTEVVRKKIEGLHEDLQYDYEQELNAILDA